MGFWDEFEQVDQEERGSGGGGIVGEAVIQLGYKVYAAGTSNEESFFPIAEIGNEKSRAEAKAKAQAYAREHGAQGRPEWALQIRVKRNGAHSAGQPVSWSQDRFFVTPTWTDAFKDVVKPSLAERDIELPYTGWVRIGFKPDPYREAQGEAGKVDMDQDGNPRFPLVAYITEVFTSKEDAMAAVGGEPPLAFVPEGWDAEDWAVCVEEIKEQKEMHGLSVTELKEYIKETYDVDVAIGDIVKMTK